MADLDASSTDISLSKDLIQSAQSIRTFESAKRALLLVKELQGTTLEDILTAKTLANNAYFISSRKRSELTGLAIEIEAKITRVKSNNNAWHKSINERVIAGKNLGIKFINNLETSAE